MSEKISFDGSWVEGVGRDTNATAASGKLKREKNIREFALTVGIPEDESDERERSGH